MAEVRFIMYMSYCTLRCAGKERAPRDLPRPTREINVRRTPALSFSQLHSLSALVLLDDTPKISRRQVHIRCRAVPPQATARARLQRCSRTIWEVDEGEEEEAVGEVGEDADGEASLVETAFLGYRLPGTPKTILQAATRRARRAMR